MGKILVTGGAGYVGSVCSSELLAHGHEVVVVDDLSAGHMDALPKGARFYRADIGDAEAIRSITAEHHIDAAFHFAAKALIPESVTNPALFFKVNVSSSLALLEVLRTAGVKKFVFSSSAAVYGNPTSMPIDEDAPKAPVNSYGETKLCFERALAWYASAYGISAVAFRYFNASGAAGGFGEDHRPETHIIPLLLQAATGNREHFTIFGEDYQTPDGTCLRDYVHVTDIARAHILALQVDSPGFVAYNIGTGQSYSVRQVWKTAEDVLGRPINVCVGKRRPGDPAVLCANPSKIKKELGWIPKQSDLRNIIQTAWNWMEERRPGPPLATGSPSQVRTRPRTTPARPFE
ncbi:MAG: UDP-glucose 4-epimerase GalE [Acidobacteriia bacterium]|nr:UDP-glucose 4-epimerase GalE [Terriglobia bacterium]